MRSQFEGLYGREVLRTFRNPWVLVLTLAQPFMWLALFGSNFDALPSGALKVLTGGSSSYVAFLLPGVLSTSMLGIGMFGAMSTIQDKRFGYMKRILLTPTSRSIVFLSKAFGSATRGLVGIPVMIAAAYVFGVRLPWDPLGWGVWVAGLMCLALGFSAIFLAVTAASTDWQTPGVVANFITMPLMFASSSIFPNTFAPWWMRAISAHNPVTFSANLGRSVVLSGGLSWTDMGWLVAFAVAALALGAFVTDRWLKIE